MEEDERREIIREFMDVEDVKDWADGIIACTGTEHAHKITIEELAIATAIQSEVNEWTNKRS
jgi:hypothetical protein